MEVMPGVDPADFVEAALPLVTRVIALLHGKHLVKNAKEKDGSFHHCHRSRGADGDSRCRHSHAEPRERPFTSCCHFILNPKEMRGISSS